MLKKVQDVPIPKIRKKKHFSTEGVKSAKLLGVTVVDKEKKLKLDI